MFGDLGEGDKFKAGIGVGELPVVEVNDIDMDVIGFHKLVRIITGEAGNIIFLLNALDEIAGAAADVKVFAGNIRVVFFRQVTAASSVASRLNVLSAVLSFIAAD